MQISDYTDDVPLVTTSMTVLQEIYGTLRSQCEKMGLVINRGKTKYIRMAATHNRRCLSRISHFKTITL